MQSQNLVELISSLSSEQQAVVEEFIKYLKQNSAQTAPSGFHEALQAFVREHSELLRRLAQ